MLIVMLLLAGICFGSFINALVWRLREQEAASSKQQAKENLSISSGRSICPRCRHTLAPVDLIPVLSWVFLSGKCRYCRRPISTQYPLVELSTAGLFIVSYLFFPSQLLSPSSYLLLGLWLAVLTGLIALFVYDLKWMLLPDKIVFPITSLALIYWLVNLTSTVDKRQLVLQTILSLIVSSGLFYLVFQLSKGKWIGGGDVKLGLVFGLLLADPIKSSLVLFIASIVGSLLVLPGLLTKRSSLQQKIAFGPLLIIGTVVVFLFGERLIQRYLDIIFII